LEVKIRTHVLSIHAVRLHSAYTSPWVVFYELNGNALEPIKLVSFCLFFGLFMKGCFLMRLNLSARLLMSVL